MFPFKKLALGPLIRLRNNYLHHIPTLPVVTFQQITIKYLFNCEFPVTCSNKFQFWNMKYFRYNIRVGSCRVRLDVFSELSLWAEFPLLDLEWDSVYWSLLYIVRVVAVLVFHFLGTELPFVHFQTLLALVFMRIYLLGLCQPTSAFLEVWKT